MDFIYGFRCGEGTRMTAAYTSRGDITYVTGGTVVTFLDTDGSVSQDGAESYSSSRDTSRATTPSGALLGSRFCGRRELSFRSYQSVQNAHKTAI